MLIFGQTSLQTFFLSHPPCCSPKPRTPTNLHFTESAITYLRPARRSDQRERFAELPDLGKLYAMV